MAFGLRKEQAYPQMTLRIESEVSDGRVVLKLIGEIRVEGLQWLRAQIAESERHTALDLSELTVVDLDAVRLFRECEDRGTELINCPHYIRQWVERERAKKVGEGEATDNYGEKEPE